MINRWRGQTRIIRPRALVLKFADSTLPDDPALLAYAGRASAPGRSNAGAGDRRRSADQRREDHHREADAPDPPQPTVRSRRVPEISFTGLQGTPASSRAASAMGAALVAHYRRDQRHQLGAIAHALGARGEARIRSHSGWPSTLAHRAPRRSLPAARQTGASVVSKSW